MSTVNHPKDPNYVGNDVTTLTTSRLVELREIYRKALFEEFIPWWQEHSLDTEEGGFFTRLDRQGKPYSYDKDMWMIGRQVWMFSHLYNTHEKRELWLEIAHMGATFILKHGFASDGNMVFRTDRVGNPMASILSTYTKVFAAIALAEFGVAADDHAATQSAEELYNQLEVELSETSNTPLLGYSMHAEFDLQAHHMCKMTVARVFFELTQEQRYSDACTSSMNHILTNHWRPELEAVLENLGPNGEELLEFPEGRLTNPGHALESVWMMLEIAASTDNQAAIAICVDIILATLKSGWDEEQGGILYFRNIDGSPCHNIEADCKLWWPHGEGLYATLLSWMLTERSELANWYERIHSYTFSHFPDEEFGEWYGYLNRDGGPVWSAKANGWKGFFHLPRIMYRSYQLLNSSDQIIATENAE